ncbi:hypothetical protein [Fusobacterium necrophorum]|uniref:hypothetical protein n=1 Tax=Fusobacterium necrophorum TaxID=859 RepID=UPI000788029C|nr:hypothetical protein [Fusobacterium necrophorum]KYM44081.1 hypothetical protein A2U15_07230 [Fusobacterium necrophorum subsp. funduliforme]
MKCSYCEKEIKEDERFYEIEHEFYCDACVEERIATYYVVGGETHDEEEVGCYRNRDGFIQNIEKQIEFHKRAMLVYSAKKDDFSKNIVETAKKKIEKLEKQKRRAIGEEE